MGFFFLIFLLAFDAKEDIYISMGIILIRVFFLLVSRTYQAQNLKVLLLFFSRLLALLFLSVMLGGRHITIVKFYNFSITWLCKLLQILFFCVALFCLYSNQVMELIQEMVTVFAHLVLPQLESCESWLFSSENFALSSSKTASFFCLFLF